MTKPDGLFEVLAHTDAAEQERITGNRAIIAAQTRVQDRFDKFVANAANEEDRASRLGLLDDEIREVVAAVSEEYGYDGDPENIFLAATAVLSGGHASGCDCGFCKNKGKLPGTTDNTGEDADGDDGDNIVGGEKESKTAAKQTCTQCGGRGKLTDGHDCDTCGGTGDIPAKTAADYPGHDYSIEGGEYVKDWNPDVSRSLESDDESDKEAWHNAKVASQNVSMFHEADGFSFCKCNCDGCDSGNHCESNECIESKHSGNPGNSSGETKSSSTHTAAEPLESGDTFVTERLDLGDSSGLNGVQSVGSPKIDKSRVPGGGGVPGADGLSAIDVPSKFRPTEQQDMHETPDYWEAPIGPSDTGKSIDAQKPLAPELYSGDNTDTWNGTTEQAGQASPVTNESINAFSSSRLAKWEIVSS